MSDARGDTGTVLRVDLSTGTLADETLDALTMRAHVGAAGPGARILYEEVPPGIEWDDPANRLIVGSGPLGGTRIMGSGTISVSTEGPLTSGGASTQANGFLGAYLRFDGYDAIVFQGASPAGLGREDRDRSAFGAGPAGEHLVTFAAIAGDRGHVAGHDGSGAVMGARRLKAIVAARTRGDVRVHDPARLATLAREIVAAIKADPATKRMYDRGTGMPLSGTEAGGDRPVRNCTTNLFPGHEAFMAVNDRQRFDTRLEPCWACQVHHRHMLTVTDGPCAGCVGEEPAYEQWAAWGPVIGNTDPAGALVLSSETDRPGLENDEAGWVIGWVIECVETGLLTEAQTDGLRMTWGDVESARLLPHRIARRQGFGDVLAEGIVRASQRIGGRGGAPGRLHAEGRRPPGGHDHRGRRSCPVRQD